MGALKLARDMVFFLHRVDLGSRVGWLVVLSLLTGLGLVSMTAFVNLLVLTTSARRSSTRQTAPILWWRRATPKNYALLRPG